MTPIITRLQLAEEALLKNGFTLVDDVWMPPAEPVCTVPPLGRYCTRTAGHEGPCAAYACEMELPIAPEPFGYVLLNDPVRDSWSLFKGGTEQQAARMRQCYPDVRMVYTSPVGA